jgi:hypothetical protein
MNRIQTVLAVVCLAFVSLVIVPEAQAQIKWNTQCAVESALKFSSCRAAGGGTFGCLVNAGFHYWQCSESTLNTRSKLRAALTGARAVRRAR